MSFLIRSLLGSAAVLALVACVHRPNILLPKILPSPAARSCAYIWPKYVGWSGRNRVAPPCHEPVPQAALLRGLNASVQVWAWSRTAISPNIFVSGWALGTGVVVRDDGTVITAYHVVDSATDVKVRYPAWQSDGTYGSGEEVFMTVAKTSPANDSAWLIPKQAPTGPVPPPLVVCRRWPTHGQVLWHIGSEIAWSIGYVGVTPMSFQAQESPQVVRGFDLRTLGRPGDSGGPVFDAQARLFGLYVGANTKHHLSGCAISVDAALTAMGEHAQYEEKCD